eukprot:gene8737-57564_t
MAMWMVPTIFIFIIEYWGTAGVSEMFKERGGVVMRQTFH